MGNNSNIVTLPPGSGTRLRIEGSGAGLSVVNADSGAQVAALAKGDTLDISRLGKDTNITVTDTLRDEKGKPLLRLKMNDDEKKRPGVTGPFEETTGSIVGDVLKQATQQYQEQEDAKKTAKLQAQFNANLTTGQDPQVAMLAAMARVDPDKLNIRQDDGLHDQNNITAPAGIKTAKTEAGKLQPAAPAR